MTIVTAALKEETLSAVIDVLSLITCNASKCLRLPYQTNEDGDGHKPLLMSIHLASI